MLLRNIMEQKPTLSIQEGVFYQGFENYIIRIGKKDHSRADIYDVLLFDHTKYQGNSTFTYAKKGKMVMTEDQMYMLFYLYDGFYWDESTEPSSASKNPLVRATFSEQYKRLDISSFKFEKSDNNFYSSYNQALSNSQIMGMVDTVRRSVEQNNEEVFTAFMTSCSNFKHFIFTDSVLPNKTQPPNVSYNELNAKQKTETLDQVLTLKNNFKNALERNKEYNSYLYSNIRSYQAEWLRKYVYAVACILFFFIGAPLGSIIRKGGIGVPLVITVIFFSSYYMFSIFGEKIAKGGAVPVWFGMWLSSFILAPIGIFLTYQATVDSALLSSEEMHKKLSQLNLKKIFTKKPHESTATRS